MSHPTSGRLPIGRWLTQRPWFFSAFLIIILSVWLSLGATNAEERSEPKTEAIPLARVQYQTFHAQPTEKKIDLYGRTAPNRQARLAAEFSGRILELAVNKGQSVTRDQVIARIEKGDLAAQLEQAKAQLRVRDQEYQAAKSLKNRGLQGEVAYTNAVAALAEAKAAVSRVELALRHTQVRAPFSGVIELLPIEQGDYVGIGDPIATLIELNPLVIEANVSERHIQSLSVGQKAFVRFIDGAQSEGTIRYLARVSDPATNTFAIEVEVPNPRDAMPAGVSAEVELNLAVQPAVKVTPAMLALDAEGNLGVKTLVDNIVHFVPIQLVKAEQDGVWLTGLGDRVDIVTRGQGFVRDGDRVIAVSQPVNP
ncbi:efflux RND transporter periplasmic adaptor subunit [Vibrio fluvialis]|uniref:efflux RND transporter periplasmic adaptor subunit n=1 Tax=Vibrio fluvialis TaxID=676 RepID=UPI0006E3E256|nr:efflux RND transporter periplasmic adaptor subunit [Vibrio fluvialis]EKO3974647.1 efflux RND transporter periplasmic adaptor subunit [Vibrio fluvialis]ELV8725124.1 efflux RND transporter periplasmic adaptor subunit [Vibrio fluvialis]KQH91231.1 hemolysin D [Vibrio fluvialis]MBY7906011.1 efflux RND transporter periplasmic adaptor subunit [Vibrio fluvialis]MBY8175617.1 efflux RND transporter periplasmic adaptor subunit [Vibrio fluvialis]